MTSRTTRRPYSLTQAVGRSTSMWRRAAVELGRTLVVTAIPLIDPLTDTVTPIDPAMLMRALGGVAGGGVVGGAGGSGDVEIQ